MHEDKEEGGSVFLLAFQKELESMGLFVCFSESGSEQSEGRVGGEGLLDTSQGPTPVLGPGHLLDSPPARKMDFFFPPVEDADAVSSPGLAFSSLTPESYDLWTADLYSREQSSQGLTQEDPQVHGFLLTSHSPSPFSSP